MRNKLIILGIVVIFLVIGGIFLFMGQEKKEFSLKPTQWSQEEDYEINETAEGIIVTNQKAGFSFKVPDGWSVKGEQDDDQFWIAAFSQDAEFLSERVLKKGCGINVLFQDFPDSLDVDIIKGRMTDLYDNQEVIKVRNYNGLQTIDRPEDPKILSKYGTHIVVAVPLNQEDILSIATIFFRSSCESDFQELLKGFEIN